jgi:hypoxanthine phosphoribosyltransferase
MTIDDFSPTIIIGIGRGGQFYQHLYLDYLGIGHCSLLIENMNGGTVDGLTTSLDEFN